MPEDPTVHIPQPADDLKGLDAGELLARGFQTAQPSAGAAPWEPPTPEELAKLLPQYRIESLLGRGGMGAVYKGVQAALDRPVAIKLLPAEVAANGDFLVRFQREARTLAKLQHGSIVAVYDFGQTSAGHLYFVMEYVDGTDLQRILKSPGLRPEQAFVLIAQVCEALHYAHQQGVIHRDIKPANILITKDGRAKVADFGIARPVKDDTGSLTVTNMIMGTPDYMAPEQRTGAGHPDHRADIFALGVMLYEMLTGQRPQGAFQPPSQRVQVDVRIDEVVLKALQQEPDRRYQQASEMKVDVDRIRTTPPTPAKPPRSPWRIAALVAVGILGVLALLAAIPAVLRSFAQRTTPAIASAESKVTRHADGLWNLPWQKAVWAKQDDPRVSADGWLTVADNLQSAAPHRVPGELLKLGDGAVRAQVRFETTPSSFAFVMSFWLRMPLNQSIQFVISEWEIRATRNGDNAAELGRIAFDTPFRPGDIERFEAAAVGDRFIARFKGKELRFQDPQTNRSGSTTFHGRTYALKDVEYAVLDGIADPLKALGWDVPAATIPPVAAASSSAPLIATKDKPFVNTLGQEFVPVPGTQVLFCRWETRVKDYTAFARVNKVDAAWATQEKDGVPVSREPEEPVVSVSWNDANAFCKWLTEKELTEGKLAKGMQYRLPTDEEWSCAVGLANETGATPADKSLKNGVDFSWGIEYPPTGKAGNYADEVFHEKFPLKKNETENKMDNQWIEGYTDGYATTSPVGSFPPNAYGLHDMGGNVRQWCEDWLDVSHKVRVARGASWGDSLRRYLLSSYRHGETPAYRGRTFGFRCVLAPATSMPPATATTPAAASPSPTPSSAPKAP